ncbi:hypothetical protein M408DRAFT_185183 [Serendipita vermifera MAFF 305830]|uniref:Uncharacterized protein n=1 Tax=Serendipita vermifera MAFF 305830 TaxID=933852 RepID=A0A0C3B790_SERVB|nr:hypothetical protein M408DRAFT_185183 [Serendipita vermifera MAFF 305830]
MSQVPVPSEMATVYQPGPPSFIPYGTFDPVMLIQTTTRDDSSCSCPSQSLCFLLDRRSCHAYGEPMGQWSNILVQSEELMLVTVEGGQPQRYIPWEGQHLNANNEFVYCPDFTDHAPVTTMQSQVPLGTLVIIVVISSRASANIPQSNVPYTMPQVNPEPLANGQPEYLYPDFVPPTAQSFVPGGNFDPSQVNTAVTQDFGTAANPDFFASLTDAQVNQASYVPLDTPNPVPQMEGNMEGPALDASAPMPAPYALCYAPNATDNFGSQKTCNELDSQKESNE